MHEELKTVTIDDVNRFQEKFIGLKLKISGWLVSVGKSEFVLQRARDDQTDEVIKIEAPNLRAYLSDKLETLLGGPLYNDQAILFGELGLLPNDRLCLRNLERAEIVRQSLRGTLPEKYDFDFSEPVPKKKIQLTEQEIKDAIGEG